MGKHYRSDTAGGPLGFIKSMWTSARWCNWVEPSECATGEGKGVLFYRNRNGLGVPPMKLRAEEHTIGSKKTGAKVNVLVGPDSDIEVE
jgi:omega-6 fatty acid desaturase (delta-12 desaturase)